jgi:type I restriction enzyme R subunit
MSLYAYTEDQLVEQPAIGLFTALGWQTVSAMEETFAPTAKTSAAPATCCCHACCRGRSK